jgi:hypothetical protein
MSQARGLLLAAGALALAVVLALLAVDVLHRQSSLAAGDTLYAADPGQRDLWHASEILPFRTARAVLGVGDDLEFRRASRLFVLSQPRTSMFASVGLAPARAEAAAALSTAVADEGDRVRKSQLVNLLGVLAVVRAAADALANPLAMRSGVATFRQALRFDPSNAEAKANLELLLRVRDQQQRRQAQSGAGRPPGARPRASLGSSGRGY